jgi:hypothetical protein
VFEATAQYTEPFTTILGTDLSVVKRLPTRADHGQVWPVHDVPAIHANADRATLRQILLAGLANAVHFGKTVLDLSQESGPWQRPAGPKSGRSRNSSDEQPILSRPPPYDRRCTPALPGRRGNRDARTTGREPAHVRQVCGRGVARSDGIRDLAHGYVHPAQWTPGHKPGWRPAPGSGTGVHRLYVSATLSRTEGSTWALLRRPVKAGDLSDEADIVWLGGLNHFSLLHDSAV